MSDESNNGLLPELTLAQMEIAMRQSSSSYTVLPDWSIAWVGNGWQVYYRAIDANFRLTNRTGLGATLVWASFRNAWNWIRELTPEQLRAITVESVKGPDQQR